MLYIDIADTPYTLSQGLMFRKELSSNEGMLFKFRYPEIRKFWGKNTYIPLDIAFVDRENRIIKIDRIKPFNESAVSSEIDCVMAIEANEGFFKSNDVSVGQKIVIDKDRDGFDIVTFENKKENDFVK